MSIEPVVPVEPAASSSEDEASPVVVVVGAPVLEVLSLPLPCRQGVAGVDEVGRGCLFGPVFAAAVELDAAAAALLLDAGLTDSKSSPGDVLPWSAD